MARENDHPFKVVVFKGKAFHMLKQKKIERLVTIVIGFFFLISFLFVSIVTTCSNYHQFNQIYVNSLQTGVFFHGTFVIRTADFFKDTLGTFPYTI